MWHHLFMKLYKNKNKNKNSSHSGCSQILLSRRMYDNNQKPHHQNLFSNPQNESLHLLLLIVNLKIHPFSNDEILLNIRPQIHHC